MTVTNPWYLVLWRLLWITPILVLFVLLCLVTAISYGPQHAVQLWKDNI